jgi:hypothetical protein
VQTNRRVPLPLRTQKYLLDQCFPGKICSIKGNLLTWEGLLAPSALSRKYTVRIEYPWRGVPKIFVLEPDLHVIADTVIPDRSLPHVYTQHPVRICVYLPGTGEWHSTKAIAATLVPWSITWLGFFEDWVFTDVWSGGGIHPSIKTEEENYDD